MLRAAVKKAMKHADKLGAGAKKRKGLSAKDNASALTREYERGTLYAGNGKKVKSRAQLRAIIASTNKGRR